MTVRTRGGVDRSDASPPPFPAAVNQIVKGQLLPSAILTYRRAAEAAAGERPAESSSSSSSEDSALVGA